MLTIAFVALIIGVPVLLLMLLARNRRQVTPTDTGSETSRQSLSLTDVWSTIVKYWLVILCSIVTLVGFTMYWVEIKTWLADKDNREVLLLVFVIGTILVYGLIDILKRESHFPRWFTKVVIGIIVVTGVAHFFYGPDWVADPLGQEAFDLDGKPKYMVYQGTDGSWKRGYHKEGENKGKLLTPKYCDTKRCASPVNGTVKMVPVSADKVPKTFDINPFNSPAEEAAKKMPRKERFTKRPVVPPKETKVEACTGDMTQYKGCEQVTFYSAPYQRRAKKGLCVANDLDSLIRTEPLGGSTYRFSGKRTGIVVHFVDLAIGEEFHGFVCG